ncbi:hypothetical protein RJ639_032994 [Escallonia herrerae]|uniref:Retrovirus-related Pol polyprotein from transposon TNT 1-94 n=1 Tax=Escallonia herrerae TaxID=1293975 RepID=A0AA88WXX0_9ASTE|nr:hypothetical protein RJ639_032994 [Escallonia herrerae]
MENFLRSKEYWQVVESGVREPAKDAVMTDAQKTKLEGRKLKDLKVEVEEGEIEAIEMVAGISKPMKITLKAKAEDEINILTSPR